MSAMGTTRRGRPPGLTLNPDAFAEFAKGRSQAQIAAAARISPSHLAEMLAGEKGATKEAAERLCAVLGVDRLGSLFPELVAFRIERREFVATLDGHLIPAVA